MQDPMQFCLCMGSTWDLQWDRHSTWDLHGTNRTGSHVVCVGFLCFACMGSGHVHGIGMGWHGIRRLFIPCILLHGIILGYAWDCVGSASQTVLSTESNHLHGISMGSRSHADPMQYPMHLHGTNMGRFHVFPVIYMHNIIITRYACNFESLSFLM